VRNLEESRLSTTELIAHEEIGAKMIAVETILLNAAFGEANANDAVRLSSLVD